MLGVLLGGDVRASPILYSPYLIGDVQPGIIMTGMPHTPGTVCFVYGILGMLGL